MPLSFFQNEKCAPISPQPGKESKHFSFLKIIFPIRTERYEILSR